MTQKIGILGSTGSIGTQTLDVIREFPDEFQVEVLSTHTNVDTLREQVEEFDPGFVGVSDPGTAVEEDWYSGSESLRTLARKDLDLLVVAVVGVAGLLPTIDALKEGTRVALASKEAMVVGGPLVNSVRQSSDGELLPIDSEHHGVFDLLRGERSSTIENVYLTASGGPFLDRPLDDLESVTPEEALDHPNWDMGQKITIDSATMMNKGLEIIEAKYLFDLEPDQIKAIIHPQSAVHALVEFDDRSIKAQLGVSDMRQPIQSVLFHPDRRQGVVERLTLDEPLSLNFQPIDGDRFPAYDLAKHALERGGCAPAVLNASNARAVRAFLNEKIAFTTIPRVVERCLDEYDDGRELSLESLLDADEWAANRAESVMEEFK